MSNKESWTDQWGITRHGEKVDMRGRQEESDLARDNTRLRLALAHALWALEQFLSDHVTVSHHGKFCKTHLTGIMSVINGQFVGSTTPSCDCGLNSLLTSAHRQVAELRALGAQPQEPK